MLVLTAMVATIATADQPARELIETPEPHIGHMPLPARTTRFTDRAAEIVFWRHHLYRRAEHPLRIKQLQSDIELASAELRSLDRQIEEYASISRPRGSDPFLVTLESARMRRLAVAEKLKSLKREKLATIHNFSAVHRLRQLEIEEHLP